MFLQFIIINQIFGIRYDSFNFNWEIENPAISQRDKDLITFEEFKDKNPF